MKHLFNSINKGVATFIFTTGLCAMVSMLPSSGYAGLLGTTAQGTLNFGTTTNYFDLSAVPGTAPIDATVVTPTVEYPGNQPALQTNLGVTAHISADIADHEILLTWINSSNVPVDIPASVFTFGLHPVGQNILSVVFDPNIPAPGGKSPATLSFGVDTAIMTFGAFTLGSASAAFSHYSLTFVSVPEPSTYLLLSAMAGIALFAARRRELKQEA